MIRLSVLYPVTEGASFDHEYYRNQHVPFVASVWQPVDTQIDRGVNGPYEAAVHFTFDTLDAMNDAMANEQIGAIMADVANYTTIDPVMQVSEIV